MLDWEILLLKKTDEIKKKLYEIETKQKITKTQKERYLNYLIELVNILHKKEKYMHKDCSDSNYTGIRDV